MKDIINERLILLATAQECMTNVTEMFEQWDDSQLILEKSTFEVVNGSDHVLNMSKEGNELVENLLKYCHEIAANPSAADKQKITEAIEDIQGLFHSIKNNSSKISELSHKIDREVAHQRVIEDRVKNTISQVSSSLDSAIACAELVLAEI